MACHLSFVTCLTLKYAIEVSNINLPTVLDIPVNEGEGTRCPRITSSNGFASHTFSLARFNHLGERTCHHTGLWKTQGGLQVSHSFGHLVGIVDVKGGDKCYYNVIITYTRIQIQIQIQIHISIPLLGCRYIV